MAKLGTDFEKGLKTEREMVANRMFISFLEEIKKDAETYEETMAILQDPVFMQKIKRGLAGKAFSWKEFVKRHGLKDDI